MNLQKRQAVKYQKKFANFSVKPTACYTSFSQNLSMAHICNVYRMLCLFPLMAHVFLTCAVCFYQVCLLFTKALVTNEHHLEFLFMDGLLHFFR